jgi:hypothetical protein
MNLSRSKWLSRKRKCKYGGPNEEYMGTVPEQINEVEILGYCYFIRPVIRIVNIPEATEVPSTDIPVNSGQIGG